MDCIAIEQRAYDLGMTKDIVSEVRLGNPFVVVLKRASKVKEGIFCLEDYLL